MSNDSRPGYLWAIVQEWMDSIPYPPSQRKLASRLGVSPSSISEWKYGRSFPDPGHVKLLAEELGVPYERVLDAVLRDQGYRDPDLNHSPSPARKRDTA